MSCNVYPHNHKHKHNTPQIDPQAENARTYLRTIQEKQHATEARGGERILSESTGGFLLMMLNTHLNKTGMNSTPRPHSSGVSSSSAAATPNARIRSMTTSPPYSSIRCVCMSECISCIRHMYEHMATSQTPTPILADAPTVAVPKMPALPPLPPPPLPRLRTWEQQGQEERGMGTI